MKPVRKGVVLALLIIFSVSIHLISKNTSFIEASYSNGLFTGISFLLRKITGFIPFSIGDLLYGFVVLWILFKLIQYFKGISHSGAGLSKRIKNKAYKIFIFVMNIYIVFNLLWGLNYNRLGIADQLGLNMDVYTSAELREMNCLLSEKVNSSRKSLSAVSFVYPSDRKLFILTENAFKKVSEKYPFLKYEGRSIKTAMWGWLGNYAGFTGYYNPFTGEAQVNTTVPSFLHPYVACHEVAHQIGYAKEMEANFVGYLAAAASSDTLFHYSVYLDLFLYANRNLSRTDSLSAKIIRAGLHKEVKNDIEEWRRFSRKHSNPAEPVIRWMYGKFLQGNEQPQGIMSYDEVTAFIIAYYKKFGKI